MLFYLSCLVLAAVLAHLCLSLFYRAKQSRHAHARLIAEGRLLEQQVDTLIRESAIRENQLNAWSGWRKFRVIDIVQENDTVKSFYLQAHDGKSLPRFLPGQHLTFRLKIPGQTKPVIRCYSLSDDANQTDHFRISVRRQPAPVGREDVPDGLSSCYLHDEIMVNDVLDVKAPSGKFYLDTGARGPIALVAGGIGLTPLLSMLNTLFSQHSNRPIFLFYAVRDVNDLIMASHLSALENEMSGLHIHYYFAELDDDLISSSKHQGFVSVQGMFDLMSDAVQPLEVDFYVCGPPPMMEAIVGGLEEKQVDSQNIHFESFGPASVGKHKKPVDDQKEGDTYSVKFHIADKTLEWNSSCGSLLETAEEAGIAMESGCRSGNCGACLTAVLSGDIEYLEEPGIEIEVGSCLPCISIPKKNVILNA